MLSRAKRKSNEEKERYRISAFWGTKVDRCGEFGERESGSVHKQHCA